MENKRVLILVFLSYLQVVSYSFAEEFGTMYGDVSITKSGVEKCPPSEYGRSEAEFILQEQIRYVDQNGTSWVAPEGICINGASIPKAFWSVVGSPWVGDYVEAAVLHDHYCVTRSRSSDEVHLSFFNAMRASGVSRAKANVMYYAVVAFGPRWRMTNAAQPFKRCREVVQNGQLKIVCDDEPSKTLGSAPVFADVPSSVDLEGLESELSQLTPAEVEALAEVAFAENFTQ